MWRMQSQSTLSSRRSSSRRLSPRYESLTGLSRSQGTCCHLTNASVSAMIHPAPRTCRICSQVEALLREGTMSRDWTG